MQVTLGFMMNRAFIDSAQENYACWYPTRQFGGDIDLIEEQYQQGRLTDEAILAYEIIKRPIDRDESWYKKLWNINLPDVADGHALLVLKDDKFSLETYSNGIKFNN